MRPARERPHFLLRHFISVVQCVGRQVLGRDRDGSRLLLPAPVISKAETRRFVFRPRRRVFRRCGVSPLSVLSATLGLLSHGISVRTRWHVGRRLVGLGREPGHVAVVARVWRRSRVGVEVGGPVGIENGRRGVCRAALGVEDGSAGRRLGGVGRDRDGVVVRGQLFCLRVGVASLALLQSRQLFGHRRRRRRRTLWVGRILVRLPGVVVGHVGVGVVFAPRFSAPAGV